MKAVERAWRGGRSEWKMHAVSALSATVAFLCLAFALLIVVNLSRLEARWAAIGKLTAFVTEGMSEAEAMQISRALKATPGVDSVRYVSSELAKSEMLEHSATPLLEALPTAAFPASLEIELEATTTSDRAREIAGTLGQYPGVESVETYAHWAQQVAKFAGAANFLAGFLAIIVFFAVITVVSSSTKLLLERRRNEVEVLRIVGATSDYVRTPFMLEGAMQGALGAAGVLVLTGAAFALFRAQLNDQMTVLLGMSPRFLPWFFTVGLIGVGAALGAVAAFLSLRRSFES